MIVEITKGADNPILRKKCPKHVKVTKKTIKLLKDMRDSMIATNGVGIAAPQIGINTQVVHITVGKSRTAFPMINPEIVEKSKETDIDTEGCLSMPDKWGPVERSVWVKVRFQNEKGEKLYMLFEDFEARIVQHEVDHINGILFVDHVPKGKLKYESE